MERDIAQLLQGDRLNVYSLGAYLGNSWTVEQKRAANSQGLRLFQHMGIIPARNAVIDCVANNCNEQMRAVNDLTRTLGWRFRCPGNHREEPTHNTFLESVRINDVGADTIVKLIFSWLTERPLTSAIQETGVTTDTGTAWYQYCRDVARKVSWHDYLPIGGPTDIVEVDETHLIKRKYNVGRQTMWEHHWVFGGISRTSKKRFAVLVDDRSANTLLPIMQNYIDDDSFICSDEWRAYGQCNVLFSGHGTVNHSINFLNPPRGAQPLWVPAGRFSDECLDNFDGPAPRPNVVPLR